MKEGTNEGNVPGVHVPLKGLGGTSGGALAAMVSGRRLGADVGPRGTAAALGCPILLGGPCSAWVQCRVAVAASELRFASDSFCSKYT